MKCIYIYKADVCNSAREMHVRHNTFRNEAYIGRCETSTDERCNTINISVYAVVPVNGPFSVNCTLQYTSILEGTIKY